MDMINKLNGWQRLWVVVSGLYLCLVAVYVTLTLPTPAKIPHSPTFYDQLRPELQNKIATPKTDEWIVISETPAPKENARKLIDPFEESAQQKLREEWDKAKPIDTKKEDYAYPNKKDIFDQIIDEELLKIAGIQAVEMPNGHVLNILSKLSEKDKTEVSQDYWRIVEKAAGQKQLHYIFMALLSWAGPVIILYALGWSVGWVHRGFKKQYIIDLTARSIGSPIHLAPSDLVFRF